MHSERDGSIVVAKLDDGEKLVEALERLSSQHVIRSGLFLYGIGMLRDFEIGFFDGKEYEKKTVAEPHELLSLQGSVATANEKFSPHIHAGLAGREHTAIGGHLFNGTVCNMVELALMKLTDIELARKQGPSGLMELHITRASRQQSGEKTGRRFTGRSGSMELMVD